MPLETSPDRIKLSGLSLIPESKHRQERAGEKEKIHNTHPNQQEKTLHMKKRNKTKEIVTHIKVPVDLKVMLVSTFTHEDDIYRRQLHSIKYKNRTSVRE